MVKDFFREIVKSKNRFLSILVIVALGVAFFSGIRAASPDMKLSADTYYDETSLMDIQVISSLGLTDEDVEALGQVEGVRTVNPAYSADVLCSLSDSQPVLTLMSLTEDVNKLTVSEGRLPQKDDEIFLDEEFLKSEGFQVGESITLEAGEGDLSDTLKYDTYTIVGAGSSPFYISLERGTSTVGDGTVSGFAVLLPESFTAEAYSSVYLTVDQAEREICYSDEYENLVDEIQDRIGEIEDVRCQARYDQIVEDGQKEIDDGQQEIDDARTRLAEAENQLAAARQQIADGENQIASYQQEIADGEAQIADARETLQEKEQELADAREEYEQEAADAYKEISDGEESLADARQELSELEVPSWYILGRDSLQTYVEYEQNADRVEAIGNVFPVIFFLVAALICLTTMTRMVEENRTQIGTLKALGYGKARIGAKYICYAFLASFIGSIIGLTVGQKFLPVVIIQAYKILYNNLPEILAPLYAGYSLSATLLAVAVITLAALSACNREMREVPAQLMRPEAPKNGKRIFLERISVLWKHMTFSQKSTARNLFRYKKRFLMTVLGIGGCMGLLLVGFGLKDSIMAIGEKQFGEIRVYSATLTLEDDCSDEEREAILDEIRADDDVTASMEAVETMADISFGEETRSSYMVVASDADSLEDFVKLRDRKTQKAYQLDDSGVIITEKLASLLDVGVGDTVTITEGDRDPVQVKVTHVAENYFYHYVYMTPEVYRQLYGEDPEYTEIFTINTADDEAFERQFQSRYMDIPGILNVTFLSSMAERVADMLRSMDTIIYVVIIAAGLLAFVVLYNLNNINISERRRELATLKVLGFYDIEVSQYVFRENVILTVIGAAAGVLIGLVLHRFVILTAEVDMMMFGRNIKFVSFLYSILLTFLFSMLVNVFMHFQLKKLNMVESMKSVE